MVWGKPREKQKEAEERLEVVGWEKKLPSELWWEVGKRMASGLQLHTFRTVCRTWRSSLPPPTRFPLDIPPPPGATDDEPFFIAQRTVYALHQHLVQVQHGINRRWIFKFIFQIKDVDDGNYDGVRFVHVDNHNYRNLSTSYHLHKVIPVSDESDDSITEAGIECRKLDDHNVQKILLLSRDLNINPSYATDSDLAVVALLRNGRFARLRLGTLPLQWEIIANNNNNNHLIDDIVIYNGRLCLVDSNGNAFVIPDIFSSLATLVMTQITHGTDNMVVHSKYAIEMRNRLVVASNEELFLMVPRYPKRGAVNHRCFLRLRVKAYKYVVGASAWAEVNSLGGQALFVGSDESFSIGPENNGGDATYQVLIGNRIIHDCSAFAKDRSWLAYYYADQAADEDDDPNCCYSLLLYKLGVLPWTNLKASSFPSLPSTPAPELLTTRYQSSRCRWKENILISFILLLLTIFHVLILYP